MMEALLPEMRYAPDGRVAVRRPGQFDEWVVVAGPDSSWAADVRPGADDVEAWTKFPSPAEVARLGADLVEIRAALVAADPKSELAGYEHVRTVDIARAIVGQRDEAQEALKYATAHYETLKGDYGVMRRRSEAEAHSFEEFKTALLPIYGAEEYADHTPGQLAEMAAEELMQLRVDRITLSWLHAEAMWHAEHHRAQAEAQSLPAALLRKGVPDLLRQIDAQGQRIKALQAQLDQAIKGEQLAHLRRYARDLTESVPDISGDDNLSTEDAYNRGYADADVATGKALSALLDVKFNELLDSPEFRAALANESSNQQPNHHEVVATTEAEPSGQATCKCIDGDNCDHRPGVSGEADTSPHPHVWAPGSPAPDETVTKVIAENDVTFTRTSRDLWHANPPEGNGRDYAWAWVNEHLTVTEVLPEERS